MKGRNRRSPGRRPVVDRPAVGESDGSIASRRWPAQVTRSGATTRGEPGRVGDARPPARRPAPARRTARRSPGSAGDRPDHGLAGAVAEQVAALGPDQRPRAGTRLAGRQHQVGPPAHDDERAAGELAGRQLGQAGDLVGDGGRGDRQLVAVGVEAAGVLLERRSGRRRRSRCRSGPRARPGPAVSVTTTPTLRPVRVGDGGAQPRGPKRRGRPGAAPTEPRSTLDSSIPAAAMVRPSRLRTIVVGPATGDHPHGLAGQQRRRGRRRRPGPRPC